MAEAQEPQRTYATPPERTWQALHEAIQAKSWEIRDMDQTAGVLSFNTGMSVWSWSGQDIRAHVVATPEGGSEVYLGAGVARRGLSSLQLVSWGEGNRVTKKLLEQLDRAVGPPA